jgi:hypothetical protein
VLSGAGAVRDRKQSRLAKRNKQNSDNEKTKLKMYENKSIRHVEGKARSPLRAETV